MEYLKNNILGVEQRIQNACITAGRNRNDVALLTVSKLHSVDKINAAFREGLTRFGENYIQEAIDKIIHLDSIRGQIEWHLIGPLQSNKTRLAAEHFDWVQTVDRLKIAQRLSEQRPQKLAPLNVCIQVNISGEGTKSGVAPEQAFNLCKEVSLLPRLCLRGLMAIPEPGKDTLSLGDMQGLFKVIQTQLLAQNSAPQFDTLSIGMSDDLEDAIQAGSTMIRVGTAIFGSRITKP